ncbi:spore coat protein CotF [Paenibacillus shirakamiensis]|uniref:Spore coat protein CotF n=1 Tax=Paenibacillus shirakamiensis TaxID=1265935 RepID=A0ABS4JFH9_9BACL|nr:spore coat protein [Paenibacillus shirakamiensis]MBP2000466.1 spore coat protein CotF [Paenibacillus shirakamiensis]
MNMPNNNALIPEKDILNIILADLRRIAREYSTATTEAGCPDVRQMFTQLTDNTLRLQGELFDIMKQNNMYTAAAPVQKQEVDKQLQQARQTQQEAQQFAQQKTSNLSNYSQPNVPEHQPNSQPTYYN